MIFRRILLLSVVLCFSGANALLRAEAMREAGAVRCAPGTREKIELESTDRMPGAHGWAKLEDVANSAAIDVELRDMKPAISFGGDYNTYILWAASPDGRFQNLGELTLNGRESRMHATAPFDTFAILVTAEPHFLVSAPSAFVILSSRTKDNFGVVRFHVVEGVYNFARSSLGDVKHAHGMVHTELKQALTAVKLAQRAGATTLAADELAEVERSLDRTLEMSRQGNSRSEVDAQARDTVRLAVAARNLALDRAFQNARTGRKAGEEEAIPESAIRARRGNS